MGIHAQCLLYFFHEFNRPWAFLSVTIKPRRASISTIQLLDQKIQMAIPYLRISLMVGKVENGRGFFAAGGQTNGFSQFKVDSICLSKLSLFQVSSTDELLPNECGNFQLFTTGWLIQTIDYRGKSPGERTWMTWGDCLPDRQRTFQSVWWHFHTTVISHQFSWRQLLDLKDVVSHSKVFFHTQGIYDISLFHHF